MGIEKITDRITGDAKKEADSILDEAREQSAVIIKEAEDKKQKLIEEAEKNGKEEKAKIINQKKAASDIDYRKLILDTKQRIIESCFEDAKEKIANMEPERYMEFLLGIVKQSGVKKGEIILNSRDKEKYGKQLIEKVGDDFEISKEDGNIVGGLILRQGKIFVNGSIDSLVDNEKSSLRLEVADKLFN